MLKDYEEKMNDWFNKVGIDENPFTLRIKPSLFVGYEDELKKLSYHIQENRKFAIITGATGSGKTTLLRLLKNSFKYKYKTLYLSKPPEADEIVDIFVDNFQPSFFQRLFGFNVSIHEISDYLDKRLSQGLLLLVDEVHEADMKALQWLRTITDQVDKIQLVLAALPTIDSQLRENLETLRSRVTTKIDLTTLNRDETKELIRKRIESSGGEGFGPFTEECIDEIYEKTGGFPREVLKMCDRLLNWALENDETEIDTMISFEEDEEEKERDRATGRDLLKDLPYKQREIVETLAEEDELFPSEIVERTGTEGYKTKQHAVRSINNILRRLLKDGYVERSRRGKGYVYSLDIKTKNLLVKS